MITNQLKIKLKAAGSNIKIVITSHAVNRKTQYETISNTYCERDIRSVSPSNQIRNGL